MGINLNFLIYKIHLMSNNLNMKSSTDYVCEGK